MATNPLSSAPAAPETLLDYMFFEEDRFPITCEHSDNGTMIYILCCLCYCYGCLCPIKCCISHNQGGAPTEELDDAQ